MNSLHATPHAARLVLGALIGLILLAAMSALAATAPITSDQFAPGWQEHARPLIRMGPARTAGRTRWFVPATLPRGEYVLVQRSGDKAEVIEGYRVTVTDGNARQYLFLTSGYGNVEAVPVKDVPALKSSPGHGVGALR